MRRLLDPFWIGILTLVVITLYVAGVPQAIRAHYDSRYSEEALMGKTEAQVVEQLGPPRFDSRKDDNRSDLRTFTFLYEVGGGISAVLTFEGGKVVKFVEHER